MVTGRISLVDLAGSERLKDTNSTGQVGITEPKVPIIIQYVEYGVRFVRFLHFLRC